MESRSGVQASRALVGRATRRWWLVLLGLVVGAALGVGLLTVLPKTYASTAAVLVTPVGQVPAPANGGSTARTAPDLNLDTESQVVVSSEVATAVKALLKTSDDVGTLQDAVTVSVPPNSSILSITYTTDSATAARDGAHAFAQAYLDNRAATAKKQVDATVAGLQTQLDADQKQLLALTGSAATLVANSPDRLYADAQISVVTNQVNTLAAQLAAVRTAASTPGQVITDAGTPSGPASPSTPVVLGGCLLLGLLLGAAAALLAARGDRRLRSGADVVALTGLPLLGTVGSGGGAGAVDPDGPRYDRLRNTALGSAGDPVLVQVCSAAPSPVTAVVALDLARSIARRSGSCLLVCAQPDPGLAQRSGTAAGRGLSDVLRGTARLEDVRVAAPGAAGVAVVPPGSDPAELEDLLQSPRLPELLAGLRATSVVVETAGPDRSPGAQSTAALMDVVVLVARRGRTDARAVRADAAAVSRMGTRVAGVLLVADGRRGGPAADVGAAPGEVPLTEAATRA